MKDQLPDSGPVKVRGRFQFDSRRIAEFALPFMSPAIAGAPSLAHIIGGIRRTLNLEHFEKVLHRDSRGWLFIEFCGKTTMDRFRLLMTKVNETCLSLGEASVVHVRTTLMDSANAAFSYFYVRGEWRLAVRRDVYQWVYETHYGGIVEPVNNALARAEAMNLKYAWFVPDE